MTGSRAVGLDEHGALFEHGCRSGSEKIQRPTGHISRRRGHMESEQDEKAMGANTLAYVEGEAGARARSDDAAIHEALALGDHREAVARSAKAHGAAVGRLCMALVSSQAEAQELAQETFVVAYRAFPSYRGEGTVRAFLFGIARRICSRHVELRGRRDAKLRLVHDAAVSDDAAEVVALRQRAQRTRTALEALRPTERDAIVLRYQGELSFREVAEACGVDEATARKRVSRAIARLRTSLGDS